MSGPLKAIAIILLTTCASANAAESQARSVGSPQHAKNVCVGRIEASNWCNIDFVRLAAHSDIAQGRRLNIVGYLVVDMGTVSLYATEHDYLMTDRGRSLEVRGSVADLRKLVSDHAYTYVRVEGEFDQDSDAIRLGGRLGVLNPPVIILPVEPPGRRQGVNDVRAKVQYFNSGKP